MAPVYRELRRMDGLEPFLLSTGQHREMLLQTLKAFHLAPDHDLGLMKPVQTLSDLTSRAITAVTDFLQSQKPDAVLVQGDTTSVLAGALSAFYCGIPVGHVEAGLRTGNMLSPWPEEMNRRLTSPLCRWNFAPTERSRRNLLVENISADRCFVTGNTVVDALIWMRELLNERGINAEEMCESLGISPEFRDQFLVPNSGPMILVTGRRRESFEQGFENLCTALLEITERHRHARVLFPVHLNPAVRDIVRAKLGSRARIELIDPVGYEEFVWLMDLCHFLISDSGGVQEEAPSLGKPVLVTRDTTERPEGIDAGTCEQVGTQPERIIERAGLLLTDKAEYARRSRLQNLYGDGAAAGRICAVLNEHLGC